MRRIIIVIFLFFLCVGFRVELVFAFEYPLGDDGVPDNYMNIMRDHFSNIQPSSKFDWRNHGIQFPLKKQLCDNCWAFVATRMLESRVQIEGFVSSAPDFSENQLTSLNNCMNGCTGGNLLAPVFYQTEGPVNQNCTGPLSDCDRLPYAVGEYYTMHPGNIEHIKSSIFLDGPAYFRFNVYNSFGIFWEGSPGVYSTSVYKMDYFEGGHAVLLIGWDDSKEAWLCLNSWCDEKSENKGPNGDGTFWISYHDVGKLLYGVANIESIYTINNPGPADLSSCIDIECNDGGGCKPLPSIYKKYP